MRNIHILSTVDIHLQPKNIWRMGQGLPYDAYRPYQVMEISDGVPEKESWKCPQKARRKKSSVATKVVQEIPGTMTGSSPSEDNDVIGKTKIVYLEDPETARKLLHVPNLWKKNP